MRVAILFCATTILFAATKIVQSASDWLSSPKPKFPTTSLQKGSEGFVKLRIVLAKDGSVTKVTVLKSSGDSVLDETARSAVTKWKMKPNAIKPLDLERGRDEVVEFKQEALLAARYSDRTAYFDSWEKTDHLMYAPFPSYPLAEREQHHEGCP